MFVGACVDVLYLNVSERNGEMEFDFLFQTHSGEIKLCFQL